GTETVSFVSNASSVEQATNLLRGILGAQWGVKNVQKLGTVKIAGTITLANPTQVALYKGELVGQMSDGMWENSTPMDHWRPMAQATVQVGKPGMDFTPRRGYDFSRLVGVVGDRMLFLAKATKAYPNVGMAAIAHAVTYVGGANPEKLTEDWQQKYVQQILAATGETDI